MNYPNRTLVIAILLTISGGLCAWDSPEGEAAESKKQWVGQTPALAPLSTDLLRLRDSVLQGKPVAEVKPSFRLLRFKEDRVQVNLRCWEVTAELRQRLEDLGFEISSYSERWAQIVGWSSMPMLEQIAVLPEVSTIYPNYRPYVWAGSVENQADASIGAAAARSTFGVDGTGIIVGILSDSFHDTIGGTLDGNLLRNSAPQLSGDLPETVTILDNGPGGGTDEGAAMGELIHDLAPGAALAFHSAFPSDIDFAQGIADLVWSANAKVIVDDVIYFGEPMYQDGLIAQAVDMVSSSGVAYFSAAGNAGRTGVRQDYTDVNPLVNVEGTFPPDGTDLHDFGGGDAYADITLPPGDGFTAVLQWNQPYSGFLGPGSEADLDLILCSTEDVTAPGMLLAYSIDLQGDIGAPLGDPLEILDYVNLGAEPQTVYLAVDHYVGVSDGLEFRIVLFPNVSAGAAAVQQPPGWSFQPGIFDQPQIYGHCAAAGANAVAAVFYGEIDEDGDYEPPNSVINVEPFSSLGGNLPFYFGPTGIPLAGAPVFRFKPEISGPDGTNTTFFGGDSPFDPDLHPNFFGTSAAAPHAAAVAALMFEANGGLTAAMVKQMLAFSADDIEAPGSDPLSGAGLIQAVGAVGAAVTALPTPTPIGEAARWEVK